MSILAQFGCVAISSTKHNNFGSSIQKVSIYAQAVLGRFQLLNKKTILLSQRLHQASTLSLLIVDPSHFACIDA